MSLDRRLREARAFAIAAHGDQLYGELPYVAHLDEVLAIAHEFEVIDDDVVVACILHDVIEDTDHGFEKISERFGDRVAALVDAVSDPDGHDNRKDRKAAAYPRIRAVHGAVVVKLCDRLANVRASVRNNPRKLATYAQEHPGFRSALRDGRAVDVVEDALWSALEAVLE